VLKRALTAFRGESVSTEEELRWLWQACRVAMKLWDDESWDLLSMGHVRRAREDGALGVLPVALSQRAALHILEGDFAAATSLIEEAETISKATGSQRLLAVRVALAAFRGRDSQASELAEVSAKDAAGRGEGAGLTFLQWATAVLYNNDGVNRGTEQVAHSGLARIYAGEEAARFFGVPGSDPRHPDVFGRVQVGVVYTGGSKIAEHGGDNPGDRDVPILVVVPGLKNGRVIGAPVETTQIAPTILSLLGLNPKELQAVRIEGTKVLPSLR